MAPNPRPDSSAALLPTSRRLTLAGELRALLATLLCRLAWRICPQTMVEMTYDLFAVLRDDE